MIDVVTTTLGADDVPDDPATGPIEVQQAVLRPQWAVAAGDGEAGALTDGFATRSRTMYSKQK
ncbi:hypothetical protein AB0J80_17475 [Actinoplanes sp. NPDC049548]|uniref:hypothetical protein n=1 Tax=Actinoplanes sp. NPDC049548 TaxID=3155152 RepID=UPI003420889B